jgi:methyl-accepting chemotaxis protein
MNNQVINQMSQIIRQIQSDEQQNAQHLRQLSQQLHQLEDRKHQASQQLNQVISMLNQFGTTSQVQSFAPQPYPSSGFGYSSRSNVGNQTSSSFSSPQSYSLNPNSFNNN